MALVTICSNVVSYGEPPIYYPDHGMNISLTNVISNLYSFMTRAALKKQLVR